MTVRDKQQALLDELGRFADGQERLAHVVARGRRQPALPVELCTEAHRVEGCLSRLWIVSEMRAGQCHFRCDSDSAIVKGVAGILCEFYSGQTPAEILAADTAFLARAGITQHLTANRRNGLARVEERIRAFASACLMRSTAMQNP
jgi:cysteine desulfuration protein SufE